MAFDAIRLTDEKLVRFCLFNESPGSVLKRSTAGGHKPLSLRSCHTSVTGWFFVFLSRLGTPVYLMVRLGFVGEERGAGMLPDPQHQGPFGTEEECL